jgi:hypothetical protein
MPVEDGLVCDVLSNHRFAEALRGDEHDVARAGHEVDRVAVNTSRPVPIEVGDGLEATEPRALGPTLQAAMRTLISFELRNVLEQLHVCHTLLGRHRDHVVEVVGHVKQAECS